MTDRAPRENELRRAMDACLPGLENRPDFEREVLRQARGEIKRKKKRSAGLVLAIVLVLLSAAALAVSALYGLLYADQGVIGSPSGCAATEDTLYYLADQGLCAWTPQAPEGRVLISGADLSARGVSVNALLFWTNRLTLLDQDAHKLWACQGNELTLLLDDAGTALGREKARFASPVFQDGFLFLRALQTDANEESAVLCKADIAAGTLEALALPGVIELSAYEPGTLLALQRDGASREDRLLALSTATGAVERQLCALPALGIEGIAYDKAEGAVYAVVNGSLSRWEGNDWVSVADYAFHHLSHYRAITSGGYVSVSYDGVQYVPLAAEARPLTLAIRGFRAPDNLDQEYQQLHPGVAIARQQAAVMDGKALREAIQAGDTTDLFCVKLDADIQALMADGLAAPLSASPALQADAQETLPQIQTALFTNDVLCAVPSELSVTLWRAREETAAPETLEAVLREHLAWNAAGNEALYLANDSAEQEWQQRDYAVYWLRTCLLEAQRANEAPDFQTSARLLKALKSASFQHAPEAAGSSVLTPDAFLSLRGESESESQSQWLLPPTVKAGAEPLVPARLHVYLLNPNSLHKEAAIAYLEYLAAHRSPHAEALLKPDRSSAALYPGVETWIAQIEADQRKEDKEARAQTDEAALQARIAAIKADPSSWEVTQEALAQYRQTIAPRLNLALHPLLTGLSSADFDAMLQTLMDYLEGRLTLARCTDRLSKLYAQAIENADGAPRSP
ncbi:MAG: hypothetical protein PHY12_11745 [Eubacteriales bacterium]|nr:hypothetical protein [Eubacteriales bacterium]